MVILVFTLIPSFVFRVPLKCTMGTVIKIYYASFDNDRDFHVSELRRARSLINRRDYLFPGPRSEHKPFSVGLMQRMT